MEPLKCIFCNPDNSCILIQNHHAYARYDGFPVNPGHVLIIPYRHISSLFEMTAEEREDVWKLLNEIKEIVETQYHPDGFNVGVNIGKAAGQSVFHVHIHVIPRYEGDMENPKGGVRGVIPAKRLY